MSKTAGYWRFFPYEEPYENQPEAMERIYNALDKSRNVLFEGACGTGKTLSALAPALEHAREEDKTVVITTNVHQQMRQFIEEARAITRTESITAVVFRGKESMCHLDVGYQECQALRDTTRELVELEEDQSELEAQQRQLLDRQRAGDGDAADARSAVMDELEAIEADIEDLQDQNTCSYFHANLTENTNRFFQWLHEDVRTPDEIYEWAEDQGWCGYELLKLGMADVDLVICNYHHLLDPMIRQQFFRWLDREPDEIVAIFDEAHNLESAAREHASQRLSNETVEGAIGEMADEEGHRVKETRSLLESIDDALEDLADVELANADFGQDDLETSIANEADEDDFTLALKRHYDGNGLETALDLGLSFATELDRSYERAFQEGDAETRKECPTLSTLSFVHEYLETIDSEGFHPILSVDLTASGRRIAIEQYACIPRPVTGPLFENLSASILLSATLRPFTVTKDVLGLADPTSMAYEMTFPEEHRRTLAVDTPPLFARKREDPNVQQTVATALRAVVEYTPGNVLCFFPSYSEAKRYYNRLADIDNDRLLDEAGTSVEDRRQEFTQGDDTVLFTSLWGTLTEGVSFDGNAARAVVVVGIAYPRLTDRQQAIQAAYQRAYPDRGQNVGWKYGVEIPTIRKTRQALGRVVRSPSDFGARILLDRRYTESHHKEMGKYSVYPHIPEEERAEMDDVDPEKLQFALFNFFNDIDAYGPEVPRPEP